MERLFSVGVEPGVNVAPGQKNDPSVLAIELYPVHPPVAVRQLETILKCQRQIHNIALIATKAISVKSVKEADALLDDDYNIPPEYQLKLVWIDSGSIWISIKSGCENALKYVASFFETGATAKLAQQMAESKRAETEAQVSQETREATVARMIVEQDMLRLKI